MVRAEGHHLPQCWCCWECFFDDDNSPTDTGMLRKWGLLEGIEWLLVVGKSGDCLYSINAGNHLFFK